MTYKNKIIMEPAPVNFSIPIPYDELPKFLGGFVWGMTGENHLEEIEACYEGTDMMWHEINFAIQEFQKNTTDDLIQGILEIGIIGLQIPQTLKKCKNMGDDIDAIKEWASIFSDPLHLSERISKNVALHRKHVQADIAEMQQLEDVDEPWKAGVVAADLVTTVVGPITPTYPTINSIVGRTVGAPWYCVPDFIAGMIYGFTGDNHLVEIEECYTGGSTVVNDAEALWSDVWHENWIHAYEDYNHLTAALTSALSSCTGMGDDWQRIEEWAAIFSEPTKLAEVAGKNWLLHHNRIERDIHMAEADW